MQWADIARQEFRAQAIIPFYLHGLAPLIRYAAQSWAVDDEQERI
jgi:hypothetical protein